MKEQIIELIENNSSEVAASEIEDLMHELCAKYQTKELMIAMLESQIKVEEAKYTWKENYIGEPYRYHSDSTLKIIIELERQLNELKK